MKSITGVACVDMNHFYAEKEGGPLPWPSIQADLQWFKFLTNGGIVVVGDNTYQELQKLPPLKNREIWPVGKNHELKCVSDVLIKYSQEESRPLFVGGGGRLWKEFSEWYDCFYVTVLKKNYVHDGRRLNVYGDCHEVLEKENYTIFRVSNKSPIPIQVIA